MLEPHSSPSGFRWRRTAFARIDGAVDIAEDDWSLVIGGMSAARIYRVPFIACAAARTMGDGFGPSRSALVASRSTSGRGTRPGGARGLRGDLAGNGRRLSAEAAARGEALGDDLAAVTGTSLDKGLELDALAKAFSQCDQAAS